jgi:predicted GIY-YIG superfamily endonuclease
MKPTHLPLRPFDAGAIWLEAVTDDERELQRTYRCGLYRFYDANRALLYVGISRNLADRWNWHRCKTAWYSRARYVALSFYPQREDAFRSEAAAIRTQNPLFNTQRYKPHLSKKRSGDDSLHAPPAVRLAGED